jgi:hypothetical protein
MKYLFVGGPRHGEFISVSDSRRVIVFPVMEPLTASTYWGVSPEYNDATFIRTCEYERADIGTDRIVYLAKRVSPAR